MERLELLLPLANLVLELDELAVAELRRAFEVARALGALVVRGQGLPPLLGFAHRGDERLLDFPAALEGIGLLAQLGDLGLDGLEALGARRVALLLERLALDLELGALALELVELLRHRVDLHAHATRCLVDEIDRLVGEEAVGDVAM